MTRYSLFTCLITLSASVPAVSQDLSFRPLGNETPGLTLFDDKSSTECEKPVKLEDLRGARRFHSRLLSRSLAIKLGIPFVTIGGSHSELVLVRDYGRSKECLAKDGVTRLVFGQSIRTILTIVDYEGSATTNLAIFAADATLNRRSHQIDIQILGYENPKLDGIIAEISGGEFNVETYAAYLASQKKLIQVAGETETEQFVWRLGYLPRLDELMAKNSASIAFALSQISDKKSCAAAWTKFSESGGDSATAKPLIEETYMLITDDCSGGKPDQLQADKAKDFLFGYRMKK